MAFFSNAAVNRLNLHYGVRALAEGAGGLFYLVFLLKAGFSIPQTLLAMAAILGGRFLVRPFLTPLGIRFGLRPLIIAGGLLMGLQYPILAQVRGPGLMLLALIAVTSAADALYWPAFNAYFALIGDDEHRGRQIGVREALAALAGVVAPLAGAASLLAFGPSPTFAAVGLVQAASVLPLVTAPNLSVQRRAPGAVRAAVPLALFFFADGWFDAGWYFLWQIALYTTLGSSLAAYGGAMAIAGLSGAAAGLVIGDRLDSGAWRRAIAVTYAVAAILVMMRSASLWAPWLAVAANALGALLIPLLSPTVGAATYTLAKASPCALRYQVVGEAGWDLGGMAACLLLALCIDKGLPLGAGILFALAGLAGEVVFLWRLYGRLPARAIEIA
ncbi:MAG TPA: MFS transporter [Caulobacteraceae bacterium]|jgi:hypothetical protein